MMGFWKFNYSTVYRRTGPFSVEQWAPRWVALAKHPVVSNRVGGVVECFLADAETKHNTGSGWSSFHFLFITIGWLLSECIRREESCCFRQHNAASFRFHLHTRERHPNQFALEVDRIKRNKYVLLTWGTTAILDQNNVITTIIS